jgi:hypothetical protein
MNLMTQFEPLACLKHYVFSLHLQGQISNKFDSYSVGVYSLPISTGCPDRGLHGSLQSFHRTEYTALFCSLSIMISSSLRQFGANCAVELTARRVRICRPRRSHTQPSQMHSIRFCIPVHCILVFTCGLPSTVLLLCAV